MFIWNPLTKGLLALLFLSWVGTGFLYVYQKAELGVEVISHNNTKTKLATFEKEVEEERNKNLEESLRMHQEVINVQEELQRVKDQIKTNSANIKPRVDANVVRESVTTFTNTPTTTPADDIKVVGDVASEGIGLLEEGRQLLRACAEDHDTKVAEVEALLTAWPKGNKMTLNDIKRALVNMDEITLMEVLDISSEDLVNRFGDFIEAKADLLEEDLEADLEFYDGQEDTQEE